MASPLVFVAGCSIHSPAGSPLRKALSPVQSAISSRDFARAGREMDRLWRYFPSARRQLAHPYARLILRQGWDFAAAANLLEAASGAWSPDLHSDLVYALRRAGRRSDAWQALDRALRRFAIVPALAREARACLQDDPLTLAGWAGVTAALKVRVEAARPGRTAMFSVLDAESRVIAERGVAPTSGRRATATFDLAPAYALKLLADGQPVLGGSIELPPGFAVDGRVTDARARAIRGWVRVGWRPSVKPRLDVRDDAGRAQRWSVTNALDDGRWEFKLELDRAAGGTPVHIGVRLPDGSTAPLPDSPLIPATSGATAPRGALARRRPSKSSSPEPRAADVIIPVYRDHERTLTCIRAIADTAQEHAASIIVVDDASPEPALSADLDALAASGDISLLRNERNLGFAASVNRAMALYPEHDAVLVNSDVVVFENWLTRLRAAVYCDPRNGTATPLADDDSIVGYPAGDDDVPAAEGFDRVCALRASSGPIELPVGVGFCLYVRRDCWDATGPFDDATFGRGYGEEADWCMRARGAGWRHVLADSVFVHHAGSRSFGAARAALLDRSRRLLNLRHPGYDAMVARFVERDPIRSVRRDLDAAQLRSLGGRFVLLTTLALPGGLDRALAERSRQIRAEGLQPLVLQPVKLDDMRECRLRSEALDLQHLKFAIPSDLRALRELLESLPLESIEIHHTLGLDPRVIEMLRALGVPVDAHLHDYSWVCPRVTMIGGAGTYCGEPDVKTCETCVRRNGSNLPEPITVRELRRRSGRWLQTARRVVAPSTDAARRLGRYFPALDIDVVPNETFLGTGRRPFIRRSEMVRVAVIGAIGRHKGYEVLLACARDAARRRLPLEFVLIGYSQDDARLMRTGRIFVTGQYRDEEMGYLLGREAPHAVFLPSVWPETWCYTLSHAIASGLPVAAFDIGAMGERLRQESGGTLFPMGLPANEINRRLIGLGRDAMSADNSAMTTAMPASGGRTRGAASEWNQGNG